jgi:hypothetical protein
MEYKKPMGVGRERYKRAQAGEDEGDINKGEGTGRN